MKFEVEKTNSGEIWITHPEPYVNGQSRVAIIELLDKADVWAIVISRGPLHLSFTLGIDEEHTEEKVIELVKGVMMFTSCGVDFQ